MSALLQRSLFEFAPPVPPTLRPYQLAAVERIRVIIRGGITHVLVVAPTGAGKTLIFSHVIASAITRGTPVLVMAHRSELIDQTVKKLLAAGIPPEQIGVIMAKDARRNPRALVQVASIDTLRNRTRPPAKLVVIDECHRALSKSYQDISAEYPSAVHLGFTATPWRLDGKGMGRQYKALVVVATMQDLIDGEFLVQPLVFSHPERADLSKVTVRGGDYDEHELAEAVDKTPLIGRIVEHWTRHAEGVRTIAFAASIQHSQHIRDQFRAAGIAAEHLDGETPKGEREAMLGRFHRGETIVLCNMGVLCEGYDEPLAKCAIVARPTKSRSLWFQQFGRVLRTIDGRPDITSAIILDHAGCADEHGLPEWTTEEDYSLEDDRKKRATIGTRTCTRCYKVCRAGARVCDHCGAAFATAAVSEDTEGRVLEESDGELVLRQQAEAVLAQLRTRISRLAMAMDSARGWNAGETNARLYNRYRKSRTKMTPIELRSVAAYLESGFAIDNPIEAPKPAREAVTETPEWLAKVKPSPVALVAEEIVEFDL